MISMNDHQHENKPAPPETPLDTGSKALEEALRSSFVIVKAVLVVMVVVFIFSGVRSVGPQERAVVLRFGKPVGTGAEQLLKPGFHWAWPYPIDEVVKIQVGEIQTVTSSVGWYSQPPGQELAGVEPPALPSLNPSSEGYALTGDGNIVHVKATMRYRISDPLAYEFNFTNAAQIAQNILDNALVYAAAHSTVDDALKIIRFKENLLARVSQQIADRKLGITLEPLDVTVVPPTTVKAAFRAVLDAEQDRSSAVLAADRYAWTNKLAAQSEATILTNVAQADRANLVLNVAEEAKIFSNLLPQYQINPELLRQRLLTEKWQQILTNTAVDKFFLPDRDDGKARELRLLLNRKPRAAQPQPQQ